LSSPSSDLLSVNKFLLTATMLIIEEKYPELVEGHFRFL
jgi:hypothetical protein